jgi:hypothetical protein
MEYLIDDALFNYLLLHNRSLKEVPRKNNEE